MPDLCKCKGCLNFNPRTPCGVRLRLLQRQMYSCRISIHAPLAGCDQDTVTPETLLKGFQSTHPLRGATSCNCVIVSINMNFNPRTPCGVRPSTLRFSANSLNFNPRTPCGVRPRQNMASRTVVTFQSTHPLRGATRPACPDRPRRSHFNPRTPCGVRL